LESELDILAKSQPGVFVFDDAGSSEALPFEFLHLTQLFIVNPHQGNLIGIVPFQFFANGVDVEGFSKYGQLVYQLGDFEMLVY